MRKLIVVLMLMLLVSPAYAVHQNLTATSDVRNVRNTTEQFEIHQGDSLQYDLWVNDGSSPYMEVTNSGAYPVWYIVTATNASMGWMVVTGEVISATNHVRLSAVPTNTLFPVGTYRSLVRLYETGGVVSARMLADHQMKVYGSADYEYTAQTVGTFNVSIEIKNYIVTNATHIQSIPVYTNAPEAGDVLQFDGNGWTSGVASVGNANTLDGHDSTDFLFADSSNGFHNWDQLINIPADIADGDDDTTYDGNDFIAAGASNSFAQQSDYLGTSQKVDTIEAQFDSASNEWVKVESDTIATNLLASYQTSADATSQYVNVAGDTMTGDMKMDATDASQAGTQSRRIQFIYTDAPNVPKTNSLYVSGGSLQFPLSDGLVAGEVVVASDFGNPNPMTNYIAGFFGLENSPGYDPVHLHFRAYANDASFHEGSVGLGTDDVIHVRNAGLSVDSGEISGDLADGIVSNADYAASSITGNKITDGTISNADLAARSVASNTLAHSVWAQIGAGSGGDSNAVWGNITGSLSDQTDLNSEITNRYTIAEADAADDDTTYDGSDFIVAGASGAFVSVTGDTMTGDLDMGGNSVTGLDVIVFTNAGNASIQASETGLVITNLQGIEIHALIPKTYFTLQCTLNANNETISNVPIGTVSASNTLGASKAWVMGTAADQGWGSGAGGGGDVYASSNNLFAAKNVVTNSLATNQINVLTVWGQSNAGAQLTTNDLAALQWLSNGVDGVYFWSYDLLGEDAGGYLTNKVVYAQTNLYGVEMTIALTLQQAQSNGQWAIFKHTDGGEPFHDGSWYDGSATWVAMTNQWAQFISALDGEGYGTINHRGMVAVHGEGDANGSQGAEYYTQLVAFVDRCSNEFDFASDYGIYLSLLHTNGVYSAAEMDDVRTNQMHFANERDYAYIVEVNDLPQQNTGTVHYTGATTLEIGRRLSSKIARHEYGTDLAWMPVLNSAHVYNNLTVERDVSIRGNAWIHGDLVVEGNVKVYGDGTFSRLFVGGGEVLASSYETGLDFDGSDSYVDLGGATNWSFGTSDFTVAMWVDFELNSANGQDILSGVASSTQRTLQVSAAAGDQLRVLAYDNVTSEIADTYPPAVDVLTAGRRFIAFTRRTNTLYVKLDNVWSNYTISGAIADGDGWNFWLGDRPDKLGTSWENGAIEELAVWTNGMTSNQLAGVMQGTYPTNARFARYRGWPSKTEGSLYPNGATITNLWNPGFLDGTAQGGVKAGDSGLE